MNLKKFTGRLAIFLTLAMLILGACTLPGSEEGVPTTTPLSDQDAYNNSLTQVAGILTQTAEVTTGTQVPTYTPTPSPIPATATNTPTATFTAVPPTAAIDPYAWVQADTPYSNETSMKGGMKFEGPAICEWWDRKGFAFKATYDSGTVKVTELHEAMFPLMEGESYTYPAGYVGKCWTIDGGDVAIAGLMDSYRHLLFFSNIYGNDTDQIKTLKTEGKIWEGMVVDGKEIHAYMHTWLGSYGLGACNFRDQTGCNILALIIVQPPLGTSIE